MILIQMVFFVEPISYLRDKSIIDIFEQVVEGLTDIVYSPIFNAIDNQASTLNESIQKKAITNTLTDLAQHAKDLKTRSSLFLQHARENENREVRVFRSFRYCARSASVITNDSLWNIPIIELMQQKCHQNI